MTLVLLPHIADPEKPLDQQPNIEVIKALATLLDLAHQGYIRAVAIAAVHVDDNGDQWPTNAFAANECNHTLVASLSYLTRRVESAMMDESEEPEGVA